MSEKNDTTKKAKTPEVTFGEDGSVSIKGLPKNPAKRAAALEQVVEQLTGRISDQARTVTGLRNDLAGSEKRVEELEALKERQLLGTRISQETARRNLTQIQGLERRNNGLKLTLENIQFLSKVFGRVTVNSLAISTFGCLVNVEADGLVFTLSSPMSRDAEAFALSADGTKIKIQPTYLELTDDGLLGTAALGTIEMLRQAITEEGRARLLDLNPADAHRLYRAAPATGRGNRLAKSREPVQETLHTKRPRLVRDDSRVSPVVQSTLGMLGLTRPNIPDNAGPAAQSTLGAFRRKGRQDLSPHFGCIYERVIRQFEDSTLSSGPSNDKHAPLYGGLLLIVDNSQLNDPSLCGDGRPPYGIIPTANPGTNQDPTPDK